MQSRGIPRIHEHQRIGPFGGARSNHASDPLSAGIRGIDFKSKRGNFAGAGIGGNCVINGETLPNVSVKVRIIVNKLL